MFHACQRVTKLIAYRMLYSIGVKGFGGVHRDHAHVGYFGS